MSINAVSSVNVQPQSGLKVKANNVFRKISEAKIETTRKMVEGREERYGMFTAASTASFVTGMLASVISSGKKISTKLSGKILGIFGGALMLVGAGLAVYNMIDAKKANKIPQEGQIPADVAINPQVQVPQGTAQAQFNQEALAQQQILEAQLQAQQLAQISMAQAQAPQADLAQAPVAQAPQIPVTISQPQAPTAAQAQTPVAQAPQAPVAQAPVAESPEIANKFSAFDAKLNKLSI